MRAFKWFASLGIVAVWSIHVAAQPWRPPEVKTPYEELLQAHTFAFGGVSYNGGTSSGEAAFRSILEQSNGLQIFSAVLTNGTPEGKLYSLCGIQQLAPERFESAAKFLMNSTTNVTVMRTCFRWREPLSNAVNSVRQMRKRHYEDVYLRLRSPGGERK
jgi:hypothetical protein